MGDTIKEKNELNTFHQFVKITGIPADLSSTRQLPPPSPDIICSVSGSDSFFELMAITDQTIEKKFGSKEFRYSNYKIEIKDVVKCITRKNAKSYSVSAVELILHEGSTPLDDLWLIDQFELNAAIQAAANNSSFSRIWLLDISNEKARAYVSAPPNT